MVFLEAPELSRKDLQLLPADLMVLLIKHVPRPPLASATLRAWPATLTTGLSSGDWADLTGPRSPTQHTAPNGATLVRHHDEDVPFPRCSSHELRLLGCQPNKSPNITKGLGPEKPHQQAPQGTWGLESGKRPYSPLIPGQE